jgi:hypothetical protein
MEAGIKAKAIGLRVLIAIAVLAGLFVLVGSAVAVWGFSGFRGEVCTHLGELPGILERTGRLTHCDEQKGAAVPPVTSVFDVSGARGAGRALVTSHDDGNGNVIFERVVLEWGGAQLTVE